MSGWMSKTRNVETAPPVGSGEPFAITCGCGRVYEGERVGGDQVVECNNCGLRLFVLPRSPYPDVAPPGPGAGPGPEEQRPEEIGSSAGVEPVKTEESPATETPQPLVLQRRKRWLTSLRVVIGLAFLMFGATVYWQYERTARTRAERAFREHSDRGYAALKSDDFLAAYLEFQQAVAALDRLERDDVKSRHVRQMYRESKAASGLMTRTLPEIIEEAQRLQHQDPIDWTRKLSRFYGGDWVVLDTYVASPESSEGNALVFDYPLAVGRRLVEFHGRPRVFERLGEVKQSRRVILAIEIKRIALSEDAKTWIVEINPASAFLWCDYSNYRALGFANAETDQDIADGLPTEETTRAVLTAQSRLMEVIE